MKIIKEIILLQFSYYAYNIIIKFILQVVVESQTSALEYGDIIVEEDSPVNQDLHFDSQLMHLYVMTEKKVC